MRVGQGIGDAIRDPGNSLLSQGQDRQLGLQLLGLQNEARPTCRDAANIGGRNGATIAASPASRISFRIFMLTLPW